MTLGLQCLYGKNVIQKGRVRVGKRFRIHAKIHMPSRLFPSLVYHRPRTRRFIGKAVFPSRLKCLQLALGNGD